MSGTAARELACKALIETGKDWTKQGAQVWSEWPLPAGTVPLTAAEAQARQDEARAEGMCLTWLVGPATVAEGAVMARAHTADLRGGVLLPGGLVAPTLAELRQMMPAGLVQEDRQAWDRTEIIEIWWA